VNIDLRDIEHVPRVRAAFGFASKLAARMGAPRGGTAARWRQGDLLTSTTAPGSRSWIPASWRTDHLSAGARAVGRKDGAWAFLRSWCSRSWSGPCHCSLSSI